jgi:hypothetical protein
MASGCVCFSHWWRGAEELLPERYLYITDAEFQKRLIDYLSFAEEKRFAMQREMRAIVEQRFHYGITAPAIRALIESEAATFHPVPK